MEKRDEAAAGGGGGLPGCGGFKGALVGEGLGPLEALIGCSLKS